MLRRVVPLLGLGVVSALVTAACSSAVATDPGLAAGWVNGVPLARPGVPSRQSAPNIVFILTDDLAWNLIKYMPHVVAMENDGATFRKYFVTDSLCCPSRSSIFTGELPHNTGVYTNAGPDGGFHAYLVNHDQTRSFASVLQSRGYMTGMFGKYLNGYEPENTYFGQRPYVPPGWSAWDVAGKAGYDEYGYTLAEGHRLVSYGHAPGDYLTSVLSAQASGFIEDSAKAHRPFMAEIATFAPHEPFVPAPMDKTKFRNVAAPRNPAFGKSVHNAPTWLQRIPPLAKSDIPRLNRAFQRRLEDVQSVDRMIGRLQAEVRSLGIADNTYFVFTSDNGLHLGEHDLRQGKQTAFDTDIKVPLIVTGPSVRAGTNVTQLAENIDLAPTFEDLAGAEPPTNIDGHTLVSQLQGLRPKDWRSAILVEHHGPTLSPSDPDFPARNSGNPPSYEAIRTSRYLYVEYDNGDREFYALTTDPFELNNRYAAMSPQLRSQLHHTLLRMEKCHGTASCWAAEHLAGPATPPAPKG